MRSMTHLKIVRTTCVYLGDAKVTNREVFNEVCYDDYVCSIFLHI